MTLTLGIRKAFPIFRPLILAAVVQDLIGRLGTAATPDTAPVLRTPSCIKRCSVLRLSFCFLLHKDLAADEGITGGYAKTPGTKKTVHLF